MTLDPEKWPSLNQILEHEFFHIGQAIPKSLPNYTLACPPAETYIKQFMPNGGSNTAWNPKNPHNFGETAPNGFFSARGKENINDKSSKED